jgi:hypothetical protein
LIEKTQCSFEELISTHTLGQIIVLVNGLTVWSEIVNKRTKEETGEAEDQPKLKKPPKGMREVGRPIKVADIKKMSSTDYEAYMQSQGF